MRIVFMGATELGYDCCETLIKSGHNIVGIFTIPKEFNISYSPDKPVTNVLFKDFTMLGKSNDIPVFEVNQNIKDHYRNFEALSPDFLLAIGWYYMIPAKMLNILSKGAAGIHASLLPKYRGNAPLVWAMINGENETGVSLFYFSSGVDDGDIIAQYKFPILQEDSISEVLLKAKTASVDILMEYVPKIANGNAPRTPQNHEEATIYPKRSPEDGLIDWSWDATRIKNFIRAQSKPYPGAFTIINEKKVTIWDATIISE